MSRQALYQSEEKYHPQNTQGKLLNLVQQTWSGGLSVKLISQGYCVQTLPENDQSVHDNDFPYGTSKLSGFRPCLQDHTCQFKIRYFDITLHNVKIYRVSKDERHT